MFGMQSKQNLRVFWKLMNLRECVWEIRHRIIRPDIYGQWTNWHDQSQNGTKLVTNDLVVWSLTLITHVNTNSIVMWVILPNNTDWDCFKTLISREILKILNSLLEEHCAFFDVIHLFQEVGCVRNKLQFHTVQQNPKSSLWTLDWD